MKAADRMLGRNRAVAPAGFRLDAGHGHEAEIHAIGILEGHEGLAEKLFGSLMGNALFQEAVHPIAKRRLGDAEQRALGLADAEPAGGRSLPGEEGQDCPRCARLVAIIEVIGAGIVEIDRLLHQSQAENLGIEVGVTAGRAGNGRDVMDTMMGHRIVLSFSVRTEIQISAIG